MTLQLRGSTTSAKLIAFVFGDLLDCRSSISDLVPHLSQCLSRWYLAHSRPLRGRQRVDNLLVAYCWAVDSLHLAERESAFTEECVLDRGNGWVLRGRRELIEMLEARLRTRYSATSHH